MIKVLYPCLRTTHCVCIVQYYQGWASVLFKRTFRSRVHFRSVQKNVLFSTFISVQCKRTFPSLRSFPFSAKERFVLYVHFRSVQKNVSFSTFISVQCKRTFRSLHSFLFCKKNVLFILVWLGPKNDQKKAFLG